MSATTSYRPMERTVGEVLDRKLARRGTIEHEAPVLSVVEERLRRFLAARIEGDFDVVDLKRLPGGASKEQFVFVLRHTADGQAREDKLVLRMDPPASLVETSRLREGEVLQALEGELPVPKVWFVTDDREELGAPAMVCGYLTGVASPTGAEKTASGLGTTYGPRLRPLLADQFVRHLARLHTVDPATRDLPSFDQPQAGTTDAIDWRLAFFDRSWADDSFEPHPTIMLTQEWLWANRPVVDHVSIIHGDYRNGNFLFDEDKGEITAVLDWELTYLGDRHHDLAYVMTEAWGQRDDHTGEFLCCALVTRDDLIAQYEELTGLTVDPERLKYYAVLNLYWAVVAVYATGIRSVADKMTHLDVLQHFVSGLGAAFSTNLNDAVGLEG